MSPSPLSSAPDRRLVTLARQGREEGYRELVQRYRGAVLDVIYRIVGNRELAKDLAQDTFVRAFEGLDGYRAEFKFSTWLLRIAKHTAIDYQRCKEVSPLPLEHSADVTPPSGAMKRPTHHAAARSVSEPAPRRRSAALGPALEQAIAQLNDTYREVVILRFVEDLSYEHIADILEVPVGTVGARISRARAQLKQKLAGLRRPSSSESLPASA